MSFYFRLEEDRIIFTASLDVPDDPTGAPLLLSLRTHAVKTLVEFLKSSNVTQPAAVTSLAIVSRTSKVQSTTDTTTASAHEPVCFIK